MKIQKKKKKIDQKMILVQLMIILIIINHLKELKVNILMYYHMNQDNHYLK